MHLRMNDRSEWIGFYAHSFCKLQVWPCIGNKFYTILNFVCMIILLYYICQTIRRWCGTWLYSFDTGSIALWRKWFVSCLQAPLRWVWIFIINMFCFQLWKAGLFYFDLHLVEKRQGKIGRKTVYKCFWYVCTRERTD